MHGVRIDHPDGLYDPQQYFQRLQQHYVLYMAHRLRETNTMLQEFCEEGISTPRHCAGSGQQYGRSSPVTATLHGGQNSWRVRNTPEDWPVYGTSGYDFLNVLNGPFVDAEQRRIWTRLYRNWTQDPRPFAEVVHDAKYLPVQMSLSSEVYTLAHRPRPPGTAAPQLTDLTSNSLRRALQQIVACFPVHRSYISSDAITIRRPALCPTGGVPGAAP